MNTKVDRWLTEHLEDMIQDLQSCIAIKSLKSEPVEGAPFGKKIQECLEFSLRSAERMGFECSNHNGYFGCVDYGTGKEMLGILGHLDVVPEGNGWDHEPFGGEIVDGRIYGRATLDDKGPTIAALYALQAIKECKIPLKRKVRIILGCDEESGMECMKRYKETQPLPDLSFSPDGEFPLTNSEKSIVNAVFERKFNSTISIKAGEVANVVPGEALATVPIDLEEVKVAAEKFSKNNECGVVLKAMDGGTQIKILGSPAHASMPQDGLNALQCMFYFLQLLPLAKDDIKIIQVLKDKFRMEYYGQNVGLDKADDSGRLTLNLGVMRWNKNGFHLKFDLRCPTSLSSEGIKKALSDAMEPTGAILTEYTFKAGYYLSDETEIVSKLLHVFKERTGEDLPPKKIGGGTYARTLPNAVSFGPEGYMCESSAHMANEYITIDQLLFNAKIIADAIISLAGQ
ncbi:MAG: M20 family peptidase [Clostridia bacterium]|nr:M20 family peptidase [Clostridia bacterium]